MNRFAKRPLTAALALALAASGQQLRAADVVILTPPGGNFAVRNSTGSLLGLLVDGTNGQVTIPFLTAAPVQASLVCFQPGTGLLGECATGAIGAPGATGATGPRRNGRHGCHWPRLHRQHRRHRGDGSCGCNGRPWCGRRDRGDGSRGRHRQCRRHRCDRIHGDDRSIGAPGSAGSTGAAGAPGSPGAMGFTGATGANGQTVLNGIGAPASTLASTVISTSTPRQQSLRPEVWRRVGPAGIADWCVGRDRSAGTAGATGVGTTGATGQAGSDRARGNGRGPREPQARPVLLASLESRVPQAIQAMQVVTGMAGNDGRCRQHWDVRSYRRSPVQPVLQVLREPRAWQASPAPPVRQARRDLPV